MIELMQQAAGRENEKISVIIPCHNREQYIEECLDSIWNQTMPLTLLEVVVVDDCSSDHSREILHRYEEQYPENLLLIECDEPSGGYVGKVRNLGIQYASGGVLAFIDSDDKIDPTMLEQLYKYMLLYGADIAGCNFDIFRGEDIIAAASIPSGEYSAERPEERRNLILQHGVNGSVWNKLYRKEFLTSNQIWFPENLRVHEDTCFSIHCLLAARKFLHVDKILYHYRNNEGGIWNSGKTAEYLADSLTAQSCVNNLIKQYNRESGEDHIAMECIMYAMIFSLKSKCVNIHREDLYREMLPEIKELVRKDYPLMKENPYITGIEDPFHITCRNELFG